MNDFMIEQVLKEKRQDMLREAERLRMISEYEKARGVRIPWLANACGDLLIHLGERLKRRAQVRVGLQADHS